MQRSHTAYLLGFVLAFLGGLAGGWLAASLSSGASQRQAPTTQVASPGGEASTDPRLTKVLEELLREVRSMNTLRAAAAERGLPDEERSVVRPPGEEVGTELERLTAVVEQLTLALRSSALGGSGGGFRTMPLQAPAPTPALRSRLLDLKGLDYEELSRSLRFMTYQQVLDRFGPPDEIHSENRWFYEDEANKLGITFLFHDGFVVSVFD